MRVFLVCRSHLTPALSSGHNSWLLAGTLAGRARLRVIVLRSLSGGSIALVARVVPMPAVLSEQDD